ncbi:MAG TPA: S8 family serine peptidase [Rhodanobacteraceae bacterium]|nr:S8 family serine peptidase [Rhodanobacteraceae bacterium]
MSGVAPHANLIVYYICSPDGCANSAAAAAAESVVADGVASAINFSISGGTHPWGGVVEQAFLSATSAGVFVAAAAGNTNQTVPNAVAGTAQHWEPWVTTVAAGTHTGGAISSLVDVTGPGTPPSSVMGLYANPAVDGTPPSAAVPGTTPLVLSPQFQNQTTTGNDGCSPYAADTFANSIALVSRGGCAFYIKAINAAAAGATAVLISNNSTGGLIPVLTPDPGQPVVAVPVWGMTQADASSLQGFLLANSGTTASVSLSGRIAVQPDVLGDFSLLGPGGSGVIKPDVQAPGVSILAAIANDGSAAGPSLVSLYDGTSMATPHTTGAATLLMGLHPDWTPSEVKSALMMTAKETGLTKPDMVTPSDYYDRGAGRIRVDIASAAGLVMDETRSRYLQADPAMGGDPATLNLPSMEDLTCYSPAVMGCSFVRTFRSTVTHTVNWTASITGPAAGAISLLPGTTFSTLPNGAVSVQLDVDSSAMPADGTPQFAELTLAPDDGSPDLHLPISVAMQAPVISVQPMVNLDLAGAATGQTTVQVANVGGPGLQFQQETDTSAFNSYVVNDYAGGSGRGYFSTKFSDAGFGFYAAQPFVITGYAPVNLSTIIAPGFEIGSGLASFGPSTPLHIAIYADDGGKPAGNPEAASPAPVWSLDTTLGGAEIYLAGDTILAFPTTSTQLVPGKYWLSVYPELPCNANTAGNCTDGWAWRLDTNANSPVGASIFPAGQSPGNTWQPVVEQRGFALYLDSTQTCSAPAWLGLSPGSGALDAGTSMPLTVTATAASMTAAQATSYLCLSSNTVPTYNSPSLIQVNVKK